MPPKVDFKDQEKLRLIKGNNVYLFATWKPNKVEIIYKSRVDIVGAFYGSMQVENRVKGTYATQELYVDELFKPLHNNRINFASWNTKISLKHALGELKYMPSGSVNYRNISYTTKLKASNNSGIHLRNMAKELKLQKI